MVSEELKKEISNAFAAYSHILSAASLYCQIPKEFEVFKGIEQEEVQRRLNLLKDFYNTL